jgi:hypothetical protein
MPRSKYTLTKLIALESRAQKASASSLETIVAALAQYLDDGRCCSISLTSVGGVQYYEAIEGRPDISPSRSPSVLTPEMVGSKVCGFPLAADGTYQVESKRCEPECPVAERALSLARASCCVRRLTDAPPSVRGPLPILLPSPAALRCSPCSQLHCAPDCVRA